jgi:hypothetical protein
VIFSAAVLLFQLSVVQQGSAPRIDSNAASADPQSPVTQVDNEPHSNPSDSPAGSLPTMALLTPPAEEAAFALPLEPGRLTPTPILASSEPFVAESPAPAPAAPAAFFASPIRENRARVEEERRRRLWLALGIAQHSTASFDAWTTRRVISNGGYEMDPLIRPFAGNASIYAAIQVAPVALEYLGWHMMHSNHEWERRVWWMPQSLGAAMNLASGVHNLGVR